MQNKKLARHSVSGLAVTLQPVSGTRRKKGRISIINIIKGPFTPRNRKSFRRLPDKIINLGRAEENFRSSPRGSKMEPLARAESDGGSGKVRKGRD